MSTAALAHPGRARHFCVPEDKIATTPPEARGVARDGVALLVALPQRLHHVRFHDLGAFLRPGDVLVVNTSGTRPAAVDGSIGDRPVVVHLSTAHPDGRWIIELRSTDGTGPIRDVDDGAVVRLPAGGRIRVCSAVDANGRRRRAHMLVRGDDVAAYMAVHGRPITYGPRASRWPLDAYQTVFASRPGSAEMASAGRPFSERLVLDLIRRGIIIAPVLLHAGVSSAELGEPPGSEWYEVSSTTAELVRHARDRGGRIIAVGTTVTRALETVADARGDVRPGAGWTELVLGPDRPARVVDGLITGWHEADASHLLLLDAVAGADLVDDAYRAALAGPYLWHEFGDACLLLPRATNVRRTTPGER